jgi:AraC family transcriptional regulator
MLILGQGEYVGELSRDIRHEGIFASVSRYNGCLFNDSWHCHQNAHISFVLKGGCSEKKKNVYERLPGKTTFYLSGEPHQIIQMNHSLHVNLEMDDAFFQQFDFSADIFAKTIQKTPDAQFLMLKVYRELMTGDRFVPVSVQMLLLQFLRAAEKWRYEESIPAWMNRIYELINDRWSESLTLHDLSEAAGVHPVTVSHYFPQYFSCTFGSYMRKLKVERALAELKPGTKLSDIAYACGFFDQSHFIRTFKALTGFLPAQYVKL